MGPVSLWPPSSFVARCDALSYRKCLATMTWLWWGLEVNILTTVEQKVPGILMTPASSWRNAEATYLWTILLCRKYKFLIISLRVGFLWLIAESTTDWYTHAHGSNWRAWHLANCFPPRPVHTHTPFPHSQVQKGPWSEMRWAGVRDAMYYVPMGPESLTVPHRRPTPALSQVYLCWSK